MTFLNSTQEVGWMPDWEAEHLPQLWRFNLHYFEWLWALDYHDAKAVVLDWIKNHPPEKGREGWVSYPMSLRLVNLCGVFCGKYRSEFKADKDFQISLWGSIYRQAEWLMSHLETHLMGNHYFENGAALAFVGSCFECDASQRWLDKGTKILGVEVPEQILPCGVYFELSPMYHCRILYLMGVLSATGNQALREIINEPMGRMSQALDSLCHPDGQIALFKDSAFGIYNEPRQLLDYCSRIGSHKLVELEGPFEHPDSGVYGWTDRNGGYVVCNFGKVGADYQPAHAHADMLSYELSLNGQRVIVDSGVYDYEPSEWRRYSRSTAAHNTVEINGQDQCELWGNFRVARRGYPENVRFSPNENGFDLSGSHSGYRRLAGKPEPRRSIRWDSQASTLKVHDEIRATKPVEVVSRIHLHPDCVVAKNSEGLVEVRYPAGVFQIEIQSDCIVTIGEGWYFPEFGKKMRKAVIELRAEGKYTEIIYEISSLPDSHHQA